MTWLLDQWDVRIYSRMGVLGDRRYYLGSEDWPFSGNEESKSQCPRGVENLTLIPAFISEGSGLVGGEGHRSLWQRSVSEWQCHGPSPILRQKLTQWLGPDEFSPRGMNLAKYSEFKAGIAFKRDMTGVEKDL